MRVAIAIACVLGACGRFNFEIMGAGSDATSGDVGGPAPVHVQTTSASLGGTATLDVGFTSPSVTGDAIVVVVNWESGPTLSAVTDSKLNTYTLLNAVPAAPGSWTQLAYAENIVGSTALTVTAQLSASSTGVSIIIHEIRGANAFVSDNARVQVAPGIGTDVLSSGALTLVGNNNYVFGVTVNVTGNDAGLGAGTSFTQAMSGSRGSTTYYAEYAEQQQPVTFSDTVGFATYATLGIAFRP